MTMMIQKAILHILDFNTNICILSQQDLDFPVMSCMNM